MTDEDMAALAEAEHAFERCAGTPYGHSVHVTDETRTIVRRALREMREGRALAAENAALREEVKGLRAALQLIGGQFVVEIAPDPFWPVRIARAAIAERPEGQEVGE